MIVGFIKKIGEGTGEETRKERWRVQGNGEEGDLRVSCISYL